MTKSKVTPEAKAVLQKLRETIINREFDEDLNITDDLEAEWKSQAMSFQKWGEEHAQAVRERDRLKDRLEITKAQAYTKLSAQTEPKLTVDGVKAAVQQDMPVQKVMNRLREANYQVNVMYTAKMGMEHKKVALEHE
jgi:hypothetical protein